MIRKITSQDFETYITLATEFYHSEAVLHPVPQSHFEATFDEMIHSSAYAEGYIFEVDGETAGYALLAKTFTQEAGGEVLWIEEVYIRPAFRSKGLGKAFFAYLEANKSERVKRIRLEVEADNQKAIDLYTRLGFKPLDYKQMIKDF